MTLILIIAGILIALGVSLFVAMVIRSKPKKAEESERGEILKQLLALSEAEASTSPMAVRSPRLAFATASASDRSPKAPRREPNAKQRYSPQGPKSPVLIRPKDPEVEEQIRRRAYELYQQRGGVGGNATQDWLQAKDEVLRSKGKAGKTLS